MVAPSGSFFSGLRRARSVRPPSSPFLKNQRMASKKYVVGESHGGYRGPRIMHYLRAQLRVAMNSTILVSPFLNPALAMASVVAYARGEYAQDLLKGRQCELNSGRAARRAARTRVAHSAPDRPPRCLIRVSPRSDRIRRGVF
jgi:carboxypeptidase C (cathepsin A)